MGYQPPSREELEAAITDLHNKYEGTDQSRKNLIKDIQSIAKAANYQPQKLMLGLLVFGIESISDGYKWLSPHGLTLVNKGSSLLDRFEKILRINESIQLPDADEVTKNKLPDHKRLAYLTLLRKILSQDSFKPELVTYKNKQELINKVEAHIIKVLEREKADREILLQKRPTAEALKRNLAEIPKKYHEHLTKLKKSLQDSERFHLIKLLEKVIEDCPQMQLDSAHISSQKDSPSLDNKPIGYLVRSGALLYIIATIDPTYLLTSSDNSTLNTLAKHALNIKKVTDLTPYEQSICYEALSNYMPKIDQTQGNKSAWETNDWPGAREFILETKAFLSSTINELDKVTRQSRASAIAGSMESAAVYAASFGMSIYARRYPLPFSNDITKNAVGAAAGALTFVVSGNPNGAFIVSELAILAEEKIIPATLRKVLENVLHRTASLAAKGVGHTVCLTISIPMSMVKSLITMLSAKKNTAYEVPAHEDSEWTDALLELPDNIFPAKEKEIVRNIVEKSSGSDAVEQAASLASTSSRGLSAGSRMPAN